MTPENPSPTTIPFTMTFNDGVILAANAISDLCLILDGLDCLLLKSERIFLNHDGCSTLLTIPRERLFTSLGSLSELALGDTSGIERLVAHAAGQDAIGGVFVSASSKLVLTDPNYDTLLDPIRARKPGFYLKRGDFRDDWLSGYAAVCEEIARTLPLPEPPARRDPKAVALVGYLMDRNEGDHTANLAHITELLTALGLDCRSIWLSGCSLKELGDISQASTILALPYATDAARILAGRLGCGMLELPLPLGLAGTRDFLATLGEHFDCAPEASRLADAGEAGVIARIGNLVPTMLEGRRYALLADPHMAPALVRFLREFGAGAETVFLLTSKSREWDHERAPVAGRIIHDLSFRDYLDVMGAPESAVLDFIITPSQASTLALRQRLPLIEFGVPSYFHHCLTPSPFLGYEGTAGLVERIVNGIAWHGYLFAGR